MLALLAAAELLLPYSGPLGIYSASDRVTRWSLRPGYRGVGPNLPDVALSYTMQVNNLGLRGGPLALPKPAGVIRIAALGDSVTFGFGVSEEETYPARVASLLAADVAPKRTDWVNAGVPGFSILQGLGQLDKRVLPTRPDIVVVPVRVRAAARGAAHVPVRSPDRRGHAADDAQSAGPGLRTEPPRHHGPRPRGGRHPDPRDGAGGIRPASATRLVLPLWMDGPAGGTRTHAPPLRASRASRGHGDVHAGGGLCGARAR